MTPPPRRRAPGAGRGRGAGRPGRRRRSCRARRRSPRRTGRRRRAGGAAHAGAGGSRSSSRRAVAASLLSHDVVLRAEPGVRGLRQVLGRHGGPDRRALRVGDLVGGDAEDERLERASFVPVPRQGGQHGETDLLGHVVGGVLAPGQPAQSCTAVAVDDDPDVRQQRVARSGVIPQRRGLPARPGRPGLRRSPCYWRSPSGGPDVTVTAVTAPAPSGNPWRRPGRGRPHPACGTAGARGS